MTDQGATGPNHPSVVPPVVPAELGDEASWPKPVGIVSICLGALSVGCIGCGTAFMFMPVVMPDVMSQQFPDGMPPQMQTVSPSSIASLGAGGLVAILLIIAGSTLLMRRPVARMLHLVYGVLGVISFGVGVYLTVQMQEGITDWCNQNPGTKFAQSQQAQGPMQQAIGWVFQIALGFIWPAFCLIWFGGIKRDAAEIRRGLGDVL